MQVGIARKFRSGATSPAGSFTHGHGPKIMAGSTLRPHSADPSLPHLVAARHPLGLSGVQLMSQDAAAAPRSPDAISVVERTGIWPPAVTPF